MFFKLAKQPEQNFPNQYQLGSLILNTDNGWHRVRLDHKIFVYKGYLENAAWSAEFLLSIQDHQQRGNFTVFCFDTDTLQISIYTNQWRGFLMWYEPQQWLSNLDRSSHTVWNDSTVVIEPDLSMIETKIDIIGDTYHDQIDLARAKIDLDAIIDERVRGFLISNQLPLKVFCSGGVDSTLVWSYIKQHTQDYELILENRIQWDEFWCRNQKKITREFWAYQQIHHWLEPCVLTSGAPGDEFMFRSPTTVNLWCMYHDIDIFDLLRDSTALHHGYFMQEKHQKLFAQQHQDRSLDAVMALSMPEFSRYLLNIISNDCQHWHLGNTLTFTPLRDLRIFKTLLRLSPGDLTPQILNSSISRQLIADNDQSLLAVMSDIKNVGESLANMSSLISR